MQQSNKRKKQVLFLSLILVVFTGFGYFGYKNFVQPKVQPVITADGLNSKLPEAEKPRELNKLELYMQAEKDSLAKAEQKANDPNMIRLLSAEKQTADTLVQSRKISVSGTSKNRTGTKGNKTEVNRDSKMDEIYKLVNEKPNPQEVNIADKIPVKTENKVVETVTVDPELKQLGELLDKLKEVQHPESVKANPVEPSKKVDTLYKSFTVNSAVPNQTIQAVVHGQQLVYSGGKIKFRLLSDIIVKDTRIPKSSSLYGIGEISNERLYVQLKNITYDNRVFPVSLTVYDIDGIEGISIYGLEEREVIKEGADQAIQSVNFANLNPTVSGQITSAGIQATKSLLSKKVRKRCVTVKASHHILLQNTN